jgi:phenylalanyl-tRNA synthetase beta chain
VSLLLDASIPAGRIHDVITGTGEALVTGAWLLEDFRDEDKLGAGNKSMLWAIAYRSPERTLTDAEVDRAHEAIVVRLVENLPAQRR